MRINAIALIIKIFPERLSNHCTVPTLILVIQTRSCTRHSKFTKALLAFLRTDKQLIDRQLQKHHSLFSLPRRHPSKRSRDFLTMNISNDVSACERCYLPKRKSFTNDSRQSSAVESIRDKWKFNFVHDARSYKGNVIIVDGYCWARICWGNVSGHLPYRPSLLSIYLYLI